MKKIYIHCHCTNREVRDIIPPSASIQEVWGYSSMYDFVN